MKNVINYFYNMTIDEYKKREQSFIFSFDNDEFEFVEYYGDANRLINIYSVLKTYGIKTSEIVINKNNSLITNYNNKPYILLKKFSYRAENNFIEEILMFDCKLQVKEPLKWKNLWKQKIDYYELQLDEISTKYPILKQTFNYYAGLNEVAINLLNYIDEKNILIGISHIRLDKTDDLVNPLNIIIDSRIRDIAEYIKTKYFYDDIEIYEIFDLIHKKVSSKDELILLMSRLFYPSYYLDLYDKLYNSNDVSKQIINITKKNSNYEKYIQKIYKHIQSLYNIPQIEFLEN